MKRPNATLIGAFVVGGIVLVVIGILAATGGALFSRTERAVMHFSGSIFGLQVGAPVVFRGVRLGNVASIGLVYDTDADEFLIPVVAELDRDAIRIVGDSAESRALVSLPALVDKGLSAQLGTQSLVTGQLYIDLDLRPDRPSRRRGRNGGWVEIPTSATTIQNLKEQLDTVDLRKLAEDLSAIAGSARALVTGPRLGQALDDLAATTGNVRQLSEQLGRRSGPLIDSAQETLRAAGDTAQRLSRAADAMTDTAQRLSTTADHVGAAVAPDSPLMTGLQQGAEELARTAAALRRHTGDDAALPRHLDQALQDVSRAARAVRELADLLERQPDALLRGRDAPPPVPPITPAAPASATRP